MSKNRKILSLYHRLIRKYGEPEKIWSYWLFRKKRSEDREIIAIGAILTQRTSWRNAEMALENLKRENLLSLKKIASIKDKERFKQIIRPAGFVNAKAETLMSFSSDLVRNYKNIENLRKEKTLTLRTRLLSIKGIGSETADTILLYALDKPSFVIDEYTRRFVVRHKLSEDLSYEGLKKLFEDSLPKDLKIFQNYHVLIIVDQKGKEKSLMRDFR